MKRILIGTVALFLTLVIVLAVVTSLVDWSKYEPLIAAKVQSATGYSLATGGKLDVNLLPSPHLVVEKLTLTAPGAAKPLIALDRAEVKIAFLPLLGGHVVIDSIAMMHPQINASIDETGRASWMTPQIREKMNAPSNPNEPKSKAANRIALREIYIKDASIVYDDRQKKQSYALNDVDLTVHGEGLYGPYEAEGTVSYKDKPLKLTVKSEALDPVADTVKVSVEASMPGLASASYNGLIGLKKPIDMQGEAKLSASSVKKLLDFANGGAASASLDKPVNAEGLISVAADHAGWTNLKVKFGDAGFSGGVAVKNIQAGAKAPLDVNLTLVADKAVDLTPWTPDAGESAPLPKKGKAAIAPVAVKEADFLPDNVTLPRPVTLRVMVSAPQIQYKTTTLKGFSLSGNFADKQASGLLKADIPGGTFSTEFALAFAHSTVNAAGGIVLSDPALTYKTAVKTVDGAQALAPFLPADQLNAYKTLIQGPVSLTANGDVKGRSLNLSSADLSIGGSAVHLQGAYTPNKTAGRDALAVTASADQIDVDQWLLRLPPTPALVAAAPVDAKTRVPAPDRSKAIRAVAQKLILPFDLDVTLTAGKLRLKGADYKTFSLLGSLRGPALALKTFQINDPAGNSVLAAGTVGDLAALKDIDLSFQGQTKNLKAILAGFDPKYKTLPDNLQDASLVSEVKGDADAVSFTANLKSMGGTLDTTGAIAQPLGQPAVTALTFRLRHPSFVDVARLFRPDFSASVAIKKTLDLFVSVKRDKSVYTFSDLQGTVGPATFTGDVTADVSGARPSVKAHLQMSDVPLDDLIGHGGAGGGGAAHGGDTATVTPDAPATGAGGHWSRTPIDVSWMRKVDGSLTATVKSLSYGTWKLDNGATNVALKDGVLTLTKMTGGMYGGQVALTGKVTAPAEPGGALAVQGSANLDGVSIQSFVNAFAASKQIDARGSLSLKTDITASGGSPAALIAGLNGKGTTTGKNILFNGFDLVRMSRTLAAPTSSIKDNLSSFSGAFSGGSTSFDSLDGAFTITKGVVNLSPLKLTGTAATVSSPGTIDLPLWRIDMEATVQVTDPKDAPPLKVAFKGPLDQPGKAFGQSALQSYAGAKLQSLLSKALAKKGLATPLNTAPATGDTTATPGADPAKLKPKDLLNNMLQGVLQH